MVVIVKDSDTLIMTINGKTAFYPLEELPYAKYQRIDRYLTSLVTAEGWQYCTTMRGNGLDARQVETWVMFAAVEARPVDLGRVA